MDKKMWISLRDLKFLLECEEKAQSAAKVGYSGAHVTGEELKHALNNRAYVSIDAVEGALFSFEELQKEGYAVKHPEGLNKNQWARRLCPPGLVYDEELGIYHKK